MRVLFNDGSHLRAGLIDTNEKMDTTLISSAYSGADNKSVENILPNVPMKYQGTICSSQGRIIGGAKYRW